MRHKLERWELPGLSGRVPSHCLQTMAALRALVPKRQLPDLRYRLQYIYRRIYYITIYIVATHQAGRVFAFVFVKKFVFVSVRRVAFQGAGTPRGVPTFAKS